MYENHMNLTGDIPWTQDSFTRSFPTANLKVAQSHPEIVPCGTISDCNTPLFVRNRSKRKKEGAACGTDLGYVAKLRLAVSTEVVTLQLDELLFARLYLSGFTFLCFSLHKVSMVRRCRF